MYQLLLLLGVPVTAVRCTSYCYFFHVWPANWPTIPGVALCNEKVVDPWSRTFFCDVICVWVKRNFIAELCN